MTKSLLCAFPLLLLNFEAPSTPFEAGISWKADYREAFAEAKERDTIVFLAVNMDGERANDTAAKKLYTDKLILPLAAEAVSLVASKFEHAASGACPRFGTVTCTDHQTIDKAARSQILKPGATGEVIAPHHVFLDKQGNILMSVPYQIDNKELAWCFTASMQKAYPDREVKEVKGARAPRRLVMDGVTGGGADTIRPLTEEELEETIKRIRSTKRLEDRINDLYSLIATDHPDAIEVLERDLKTGDVASAFGRRAGPDAAQRLLEGRTRLIHRIGVYSPPSYWEAIASMLEDPEEPIRHEAAVALEQLAAPDSVKALKSALKDEESPAVRRCLVRALGTAGVDESSARKQLTSLAKSKKDPDLQKVALFALGGQVEQKSVVKLLTET
ncbi:MAG: HEAT repeat domain-containing protein, partial [Planctomycetota bacterium]